MYEGRFCVKKRQTKDIAGAVDSEVEERERDGCADAVPLRRASTPCLYAVPLPLLARPSRAPPPPSCLAALRLCVHTPRVGPTAPRPLSITNALMAVIGDEDTVTGMLLAGVGNVDARRTSNFLVVDSSAL